MFLSDLSTRAPISPISVIFHVQDHRVLTGDCPSPGGGVRYWPLALILRELPSAPRALPLPDVPVPSPAFGMTRRRPPQAAVPVSLIPASTAPPTVLLRIFRRSPAVVPDADDVCSGS